MKIEALFDICMALLINFTKFELSKGKFLPYAKKKNDFWTILVNYRKKAQIWQKTTLFADVGFEPTPI